MVAVEKQAEETSAGPASSCDKLPPAATSSDVIDMLGFDPREIDMLGFEIDDAKL